MPSSMPPSWLAKPTELHIEVIKYFHIDWETARVAPRTTCTPSLESNGLWDTRGTYEIRILALFSSRVSLLEKELSI